jgi:cytochrome c5
VSKHDTRFFNVFSIVLGLLVAFAILVFALARYVGKHEQNASLAEEPMLQQTVAERLAVPARVAVAGQDNTALAIAPVSTAAATTTAAMVLENGEQVYEQACKTCHSPAMAQALGAPAAGNKAAWAPRIAQGKPTLYKHALEGFKSKPESAGMPAKGGRTDLSDDLVKQAVDHLIAL